MNAHLPKYLFWVLLLGNFTLAQQQSDILDSDASFDLLYESVSNAILRDCSFSVQQITQLIVPFTIQNPGLYCLAPNVTTNSPFIGRLVVNSGTGIIVASNNVIIDFNDTILDGQGGGNIGIQVNSGMQNVIIRNGTIRGMTGSGIFLSNNVNQLNGPIIIENIALMNNSTGITANNPFNLFIRNVRAFFSTNVGFFLNQVSNSIIKNCISSNSTTHGFTIFNANSVIFSMYCASKY